MESLGIVVGCDASLEWLLPWWWNHYSQSNSHPVAFMDFGMSEQGIAWCKERGIYKALSELKCTLSSTESLPLATKNYWELRYGAGIWSVRAAWMKKPWALLECPFTLGIWIDLDCQVLKDVESLFNCLHLGIDLALARDGNQNLPSDLPGEIHYNSGVIAFRQGSSILQQWVDVFFQYENQLPGDQEMLSRAIFLHRPHVLELPPMYNWSANDAIREETVIRHFHGGRGKIKIIESFAHTPSISRASQQDDSIGRLRL